MTSKVTVGILIFLVLLSGGLAYYAYSLGQQIDALGTQLLTFQTEQAAQMETLHDEFTALSAETLAGMTRLEDKIDENLARIDTLEGETTQNQAQLEALEDALGSTLAKIDTLEAEVRDTAELPRAVIRADKVYQKVSQATVRISNGERTIGSGFIFDSEAHVLTAYHVVEDLDKIYVVFPDGRISPAAITGSDFFSDVAVLELEEELAVEPLALADSAKVRIGEPVAAIGNPFDLTETLTTGIVSQLDRFAEIEYDAQTRWVANLIQFDAAVNPGNSGCPLVNSAGEVIGMVIARIEPYEGDGIYYAISSNKLKRVSASLIAQGSFDYPWLGLGITDLTPEMVQSRALDTANGVLVQEVVADGPAGAAGVEVDDIIIAIDGVPIRDTATLTSYLGEHKSPGQTATLTLKRGDSELELTLEIGKRPS
ncbi:MAG TPA: PDZ domain-containing protein [Dehalococcoidia bacterium]|jgi:S1-C subfamily serine protease|nr:PDZ domain-containing protein [Dehalococcoidia bacterium]